MITLRKKSETTSTITLEWDLVPGAIGYRFQSASQAKWSHTFDAARTEIKFSKAAWYKVEALGVKDAGQYPAADPPPPPPPPPPTTGPITITQGGTYTGNWKSINSAPAVTIATAQPVIIQDSIIEKMADSILVATSVGGTQVTLRRSTFKGPLNGGECRVNPTNFKSWMIENCTLDKTGGFYFQGVPGGSTVLVSKCRAKNIQGDPSQYTAAQNWYGGRSFVQFNAFLGSSGIVEWCEVINEFGLSFIEDVVSGYNSHNLTVRNNFFWGGYAPVNQGSYSGSGYVFGEGGGSNNTGHDNQLVALAHVGCGIVGGTNNHIFRDKIICDGRLDDGTPWKTTNNNGLVCYGIPNPAAANNTIKDCQTGAYIWDGASLSWNPWWSEAGHGASNDFYNDNTQLPQPVTPAQEQAEYPIWQQKLAANGITIGS